MRIGIDARYALRKSRRGIGNYIFNIVKEFNLLHPEGAEFYLYGDRLADPDLANFFRGAPFVIRILGSPNLSWWEQVSLPLAACSDGVDLLHCPANIGPVFFKPCKIVTTIHDVIEFRRTRFGDTKLSFRHRASRLYRMGVLPRVSRVSDLVITVSEYSRRDIADVLSLSPDKIRVTYEAPFAVERPPGRSELISRLGIGKGDYIFALGAVDRRKNTNRLLEAFRLFRAETGADVSLVVAGIERIEAFALYGEGVEGVYLFDFLPDDMVAALYKNALFFVYPSLYEGFGLPILEAMSMGTPVLCSATTSVGEVAGEAAVKCDPADTGDLAVKMKQLFESPVLRKEFAERGYRRVKEFSWERCARQTLAVYAEVLGG